MGCLSGNMSDAETRARTTPMRSKYQLHQLDQRFKHTIVIALRASQFILIKPLMTRIFLMPRHRSKEDPCKSV